MQVPPATSPSKLFDHLRGRYESQQSGKAEFTRREIVFRCVQWVPERHKWLQNELVRMAVLRGCVQLRTAPGRRSHFIPRYIQE